MAASSRESGSPSQLSHLAYLQICVQQAVTVHKVPLTTKDRYLLQVQGGSGDLGLPIKTVRALPTHDCLTTPRVLPLSPLPLGDLWPKGHEAVPYLGGTSQSLRASDGCLQPSDSS